MTTVADRADAPIAARGKRAMDIVLGGLLLAASLPLLLLLAILVRIDSPGPALLRQPRIGLGGRTFGMWKLRTMVDDGDAAVHRRHVARLLAPGAGGAWVAPASDPRVTRVGRWLRATCLDELPQLVNVLRGEMSLVGPRPALPYEVAAWEPWHHARLRVPPGMTGLWQVAGRGTATFDEMVRLDLDYAARRSPVLDAAILLRTPAAVWRAASGRRGGA